MNYLSRWIPLCLLSLLCVARGVAQTAQITGSVMDPSGAYIPKAQITVLEKNRGAERTTVTNDVGLFVIPSLPPATYLVMVQAKGFQPSIRNNVNLNVGASVRLDFTLSVGRNTTSLQINSSHLLDVDTAGMKTTVDSSLVDSIPLNGRSFQALLALAPGVVPSTDPKLFNAEGQRSVSNSVMIDGVSANIGGSATSATFGQYSNGTVIATTPNGTTQAIASMEELQEFTVATSGYGASLGRQSGAQVGFATRSGTNQFHGGLFEYFRNEALDANDWFRNQANLGRGKLRQNNTGGSLGGPIWKSHLLFYATYETNPLRTPNVYNLNLPTQYYHNIAAAAVLPLIQMFPVAQGALPTSKYGTYIVNNSVNSSTDASSLRLDQYIGKSLSAFVRWHRAPSSQETLNPGTTYDSYSNTQTVTAGLTYIPIPKIVSDTRFNWSRSSTGQVRTQNTVGGGTPIPQADILPAGQNWADSAITLILLDAGLPNATVGGALYKGIENQLEVSENVSTQHGKHFFTLGGDGRQVLPHYDPNSYGLLLTVISAPLAELQLSSQAQEVATFYAASVSAYATDNWKVNSRLTLDLGLRTEISPAPTSIEGPKPWAAANFDPTNPLAATLAPAGTRLWKTRYNNLAPRLGAVYQLFKRSGFDTVLKGSWGLYYDAGMGNVFQFIGSSPFLRSSTSAVGTYPAILSSPSTVPPSLSIPAKLTGVKLFDPNLQLPRTQNWTFGIEQALGQNQTLRVTYVGSNSDRLLMSVLQSATTIPTAIASNIQLETNQGGSNYNALEVQLNRKLVHGLQALVNYTWSHSLDDGSDEITTVAPSGELPVTSQYGSSDFDVRQNVSAAVTYVLPPLKGSRFMNAAFGGWSLNSLFRAYTPEPINLAYNWSGGAGTTMQNFTLAPDRVPGQPVWLSDPTAPGKRKINWGLDSTGKIQSGAFSIPIFVNSSATVISPVRQGDAGRNSVRGFGAVQADMAFRRAFKAKGKAELTFSGEIFNIFNHPNFANPSGLLAAENQAAGGVLTSGNTYPESKGMLSNPPGATIGTTMLPIYAFGGQRDIQLALRLKF